MSNDQNDQNDGGPVAPGPSSKRDAASTAERDSTLGGSDAQLARLLRKTDDPLHQQYLRYFYDKDTYKRLKAIAKLISYKMAARRRRGSAEFEQHADDVIMHAFGLIIEERPEFSCGQEFLEAFARKMDNYDRWRRRSQAARAHLDSTPGTLDACGDMDQGRVFSFPSPETQTSDRLELEMLHSAVKRQAPDLEPLLLAMLAGNLKPADLRECLGLESKEIDAQRKRLNRLATRVLKRER
jgi:hypothetical protein